MRMRALLGSLQLPVAGIGLVLLTAGVGGLLTLPSASPQSEGFVRGLTVLFVYFFAWSGLVVFATGLAIPPSGGYGVEFSRYQRGLFVTAAIAAVASAVGPFVAFGLFYSNTELMSYSLLGLMSVAIISLAGGLLWRIGEAV